MGTQMKDNIPLDLLNQFQDNWSIGFGIRAIKA